MPLLLPSILGLLALMMTACGDMAKLPVSAGTGPDPQLPPPSETLFPTVNIAPATGWPSGEKPDAVQGTEVTAFADGLDHPRWLHVLPNGDVLVAETNRPPKEAGGLRAWIMGWFMERAGAGGKSANRITLLRDTDGDGVADERSTFLEGLNSPFGMALVGNEFFVANTDAVVRFPYREGQTWITAPGETLVELPAGPINRHWTKSLIASPDGDKLYVGVGSNSNVGENGLENEEGRAAIWEIDPATGEHRVFASGLRNPVGLAWQPESGELWVAVNERDELGSDLVPDYMTSVEEGGFYGWPYSYYGQHVDERVEPQKPDLVASALVPDYALGPHTASLGLTAAEGNDLPERFSDGMFVGQHGSWNRKPRSGYKVIFVPFEQGMPAGEPIDVLTGFVNADEKAQGRPVGVAIDRQGGLLVADDVGNVIWRVSGSGG
ncbi:Glucose/arabinose dehydrogenase, beta-propeller fold [Modicisalibacter ilicicola DSM 19980]|uniref:Glucose/arabinose dehydrogenase, beta-propeller fold n=1 Tax=Modicisalibacter ilicicola DSM 19980 TaxID=1121942 RepID=A0A1M4UTG4_9GAMM|nr:sorbosone dehydrogenase family protein [Halomonas ilicicola]SHE59969.1 Glucose/arabinose dehydrogenase, beta-propeller fold [Halomonas ilicicola DSM 19980]